MLRRLFRLAVLIAPLVVAGVLIPRVPAAACTCIEMTDAEAFDQAPVVFTGEMTDVLEPAPDAILEEPRAPLRFIFSVDVVLKGVAHANQSVVTTTNRVPCGLSLSGPGPYLVFADHPTQQIELDGWVEGELYADLCGGTRDLDAAGVPAAFGDGVPPEVGSSPIGGPTASTDPSTTVATPATGAVAASETGSDAIGIAGLVVAALVGATAVGLLAILAMQRRRS
ncbi:MAG: hypothetical protein H0V96_06435 [Acidimicrobiia bacterium]|nr:hypothetical protein [Acidimicrobiia bacterium]